MWQEVGKAPAVREMEDQGHREKNVSEVAGTAFQAPRQGPLGGCHHRVTGDLNANSISCLAVFRTCPEEARARAQRVDS